LDIATGSPHAAGMPRAVRRPAATAVARRHHRRRRACAAAAALVVSAWVVAGCGTGDSQNGEGDDSAEAHVEPTMPTTNPPPSATPATCVDGTLDERRYVLCTAHDTPDQGLVVALHGRGSAADEMRAGTELHRHAARGGLAVVYANALDGRWGDDTFTSSARPSGDEDIAFLDALIRELQSDPRIADGPIGLVGFSNGASMVLRYAAERPADVRAAVAVAGQLPRDPEIRPTGRVPLLAIYGAADPVRPYDTGIPATPGRQSGAPTPTLATRDSVAAFVARSSGPADHGGPEETDSDPTDATRLRTERWTDRQGTLAVLHTIVGGGHTWPSARRPFTGSESFGPTSGELDASAEAVAFVLDPDGTG
jgi:polyhydroxybutyrate depolymerase